jgi:shikimate dehydrogenase
MEIESRVTGKTKIMGIIGNPIEHTVSPQLHNTISRRKGIDAIYVPFKVDKSGLRSAVEGLRALNVTGFNVTVPFKNDIIPFLDQISEEAKLMGAVNTVKNVNGMLYGYNTDGEGFLRSLKK